MLGTTDVRAYTHSQRDLIPGQEVAMALRCNRIDKSRRQAEPHRLEEQRFCHAEVDRIPPPRRDLPDDTDGVEYDWLRWMSRNVHTGQPGQMLIGYDAGRSIWPSPAPAESTKFFIFGR